MALDQDQEKVAAGHNNAAGLTAFTVRPHVARLVPGRRVIAGSKALYEDGYKSAEMRWLPKVPDSVNQNVRTRCGLTGTTFNALVTVHLPTNANRSTWANYNATAVIDEDAEFRNGGWEGLTVRFLFLEAI